MLSRSQKTYGAIVGVRRNFIVICENGHEFFNQESAGHITSIEKQYEKAFSKEDRKRLREDLTSAQRKIFQKCSHGKELATATDIRR